MVSACQVYTRQTLFQGPLHITAADTRQHIIPHLCLEGNVKECAGAESVCVCVAFKQSYRSAAVSLERKDLCESVVPSLMCEMSFFCVISEICLGILVVCVVFAEHCVNCVSSKYYSGIIKDRVVAMADNERGWQRHISLGSFGGNCQL